MTFNGTIEFIIHLESFRNIDLYHQGIYYLRGFLYSQKPDSSERIYGTPYSLLEPYKNVYKEADLDYFQANANKKECNYFEKSMLVTEEHHFKSKAFMIRYYEEEIDINDIYLFRLDLPAYPSLSPQEIFLEVELIGSDLSKIGKPTESQEEDSKEAQIFSTVSTFKAKFNVDRIGGIHEYLPIIFDEAHFCVCNATVHSLLLDFKFRLNEVQKALAQKGANFIQDRDKENKNQMLIFLQPKNFTEFLNKATKKFQKDSLDNFYETYVKSLRSSYSDLIAFINEFKEIAIDKKVLKLKEEYQAIITKEPKKLQSPFFQQRKDICLDLKNITPVFFQSPRHSNFSFVENRIFEEKKQNSIIVAEKYRDQTPEKPSKCVTLSTVKDQEKFCERLLSEMNVISGLSYEFWGQFLEYIKLFPRQLVSFLMPKYLRAVKERWGESIFREEIPTSDLALSVDDKAGEQHKSIANQMRKKFYYQNLETLTIEDLNMFPKPEYHPIIFEEIYKRENQNSPKSQKKAKNFFSRQSQAIFQNPILFDRDHLFVLVHGFQGSAFDMRLLKDNLSLLHPNALFLCSSANEDYTDGDIREMGSNLAKEIKGYIQEWCSGDSPKKISFVGHSLGGIIIRAALPHLKQYEGKMHTFISLSSPHLGYMYNSSKLIDAGIWILKRWKKSKCLQQLSMSDAENLEETFLFRLAQHEGLNWFTNIGLISSFQDQYVPFESARIQKSQKKNLQSNKAKLYKTMAESLLSSLKTDRVHRIDVNFEIPQKMFENMIGRAAHIQFLESQPLMRMLVHCFDKFFN